MSYCHEALLRIEDELEEALTHQEPEPVPSFCSCLFWNSLLLSGFFGLMGSIGWAIWRL